MAWTKDGKYLAVPVDKEIKMYNSETWELSFSFTDPSIEKVSANADFTLFF